jgi:hypothetical protein
VRYGADMAPYAHLKIHDKSHIPNQLLCFGISVIS